MKINNLRDMAMDVMGNIRKGKIENVYLFYGEEDYKRRNFKLMLKSKVPYCDKMNYAYFEGKNINYKELYEISLTLPFFAEKRLVIVENTGKFKQKKRKDADGSDDGIQADETSSDKELERLLDELPPTTCLAFFETQAAKNKKLFKKIAAKGVCEPCDKDNDWEISKWIQKGFATFGQNISDSDARFLIQRVGPDYTNLSTEIKKIASYADGKQVIDRKDIIAISSESIESKIFDMLDAMCDKNGELVMSKYFDMLANKEEPLMIMAMIRRQLRIMLQVAELGNKGYSDKEIESTAGIRQFVINKMKNYLRKHFRMRDIINILEKINETDRAIKSGDINQQLGVEVLLAEISS